MLRLPTNSAKTVLDAGNKFQKIYYLMEIWTLISHNNFLIINDFSIYCKWCQ